MLDDIGSGGALILQSVLNAGTYAMLKIWQVTHDGIVSQKNEEMIKLY
jgi:hypothetical protein